MILSEILSDVDPAFLWKLGCGLAALYALWRHITKAKREIVTDLKKELLGLEAEEIEGKKRIVGPQPFDVRLHSDCVKRASYETHCRINRESHEKIESRMREALEKISAEQSKLSREVGEINTRSEGNETRLIQMDTKIDNIQRELRK